MSGTVLWLIVLIACVIAEIATLGLVTVWFAVGAGAALIAALLGMGMFVQILVFFAVSIVLLLATKPLIEKFALKKIVPTNAELDIGQTAHVIEKIDNASGAGRIRLNGVDWAAKSKDGTVIDKGTNVVVTDRAATTLTVEPLKAAEPWKIITKEN